MEDYTLELFGGFWDPLEPPLENMDSMVLPILQKAFRQNTHEEIKFITSLGLTKAFERFGFSITVLPKQYSVRIYQLSDKTYANTNDDLMYAYNLDYTLLIDKETSTIISVDSIDPNLYPTPLGDDEPLDLQ